MLLFEKEHTPQFVGLTNVWALYTNEGTAVVSAAITGTVISDPPDEADIRAGGHTIIITLTNDTWVAAGTGPIGSTAVTQAIIDGLDAALSPALGWNDEVRDKEVTTAVTRDSNTQATILLTASPLYDISVDETITVTVPASALVTSGSDVTGDTTFDVTFVAAVEETTGGGGWLPEEEIKRLRKLARDARKRDKDQRDLEIAQRQQLRDELRQTYNRVNGIIEDIPEAAEEAIALAAAEVTTVTRVETRLPIFDFDALIGNAEALAAVAEALERILQDRADEEDAIMAILVVAV